ncbi:DUF4268 domain-containing protein [Mucilaginibacter sp. RS28]|uniref:DUF4268 domain-containing protein n=2 Tax=Mucilaginibacter straminoryzae TaxID=2932774 RepID=A0A9X1X3I6_9SPHI|nr:DUF4268 domain-containing protein [Mucilaginibacter straminoryzae]MCJ8210459.1 DUF4268 domain-containing protein [Mucilaginibacter straminoryzae]
MYTREEASNIKQAFWTAFGQYLSPVTSAEGLKVNWVNYKTGLKNVYFRMQADKRTASIGIELTHPDAGIQELFFEQFKELRNVLHSYLGEEWDWQLHTRDEYGKTISRIGTVMEGVSVFKREDWPQIISFFKPRIIALDEFWSDAKYSFEALK